MFSLSKQCLRLFSNSNGPPNMSNKLANIGKAIDILTDDYPHLLQPFAHHTSSIYSPNIVFRTDMVPLAFSPYFSINGRGNYFKLLSVVRVFCKCYYSELDLSVQKRELIGDSQFSIRWNFTGKPRFCAIASRLPFPSFFRPPLLIEERLEIYEGYSNYFFDDNGLISRHTVDDVCPRPTKVRSKSLRTILWWMHQQESALTLHYKNEYQSRK